MRKTIFLITLLLIFVPVTLVQAKGRDNNKQKGNQWGTINKELHENLNAEINENEKGENENDEEDDSDDIAPTGTITPSPTGTITPTPTLTITPTITPVLTATPSVTPSITQTPFFKNNNGKHLGWFKQNTGIFAILQQMLSLLQNLSHGT